MEALRVQCGAIDDEFRKLEEFFLEYEKKREELNKSTGKLSQNVKKAQGLLSQVAPSLRKAEEEAADSDEAKAEIGRLRTRISDLRGRIEHLQSEMPVQDNGFYLNLILGSNLNVSLLTNTERFKYKTEYEAFKYKISMVVLLLTNVAYLAPWRVVDSILSFVMVWYYCTLTIRESILRVNGSKMKGWWLTHHYLSAVFCGVMLTWRDGDCYRQFRPQFLLFIGYIGVVQLMQHQYQAGCLRRLHSLGQGHEMDITVEGFTGWMFKGLTFLLPFLFIGYMFQLYNAYTLYGLLYRCQGEWQVRALTLLFVILAVGNITTTGIVIVRKIRRSQADVARKLRVRTKTE